MPIPIREYIYSIYNLSSSNKEGITLRAPCDFVQRFLFSKKTREKYIENAQQAH